MEEVATKAPVDPSASSKVIAGKYIVILKNNNALSSSAVRERVLGKNGLELSRAREILQGAINGFSGSFSEDEIQKLKADQNVAFIEPEQAIMLGKGSKMGSTVSLSSRTTTSNTTTSTSTTSTQSIPWGVARVGYGDGTGKTVWVIDSGVQSNHPDLNVDIARSKSFISGDVSIEDGYGHGTSVAGVIGAKNNNEGVVGVAANATIVALRVFDNTGYGTLTRIYSAVNHVFSNAKPGDVVNMSLRVNASTMLDDLIKKTAAKGVYFAVASGNSYIDCVVDSPARIIAPNVYVVSNMDINSNFSPSSNYGASVTYSAPGTDVLTTGTNSGYRYASGTSFAAPHVAGILAVNGGVVNSQGFVNNDPDGKPDPIALK